MNKTSVVKQKDIKHKWYLVDADGVRLGRLATKIAGLIMGKHKVTKADNLVSGDKVIVINASKVDVYHKKYEKKMYRSHSGYMGGLKEKSFADLITNYPQRIINQAVKGMLPRNKLGSAMLKNLFVYPDKDHKHEAQNPEQITLHKK